MAMMFTKRSRRLLFAETRWPLPSTTWWSSNMSTHGDLLIIDRDDQNSRQWLHAYSNGHPEELVDWLIDLPAWLASRALLSYEMARPLTEDDADDQGRSYANGI